MAVILLLASPSWRLSSFELEPLRSYLHYSWIAVAIMNMMAPADGPVSFPGLQQEECCFDKLSLPDAGDLLAWQVAPVGNLSPSTGVFGLNRLLGSGDSELTSCCRYTTGEWHPSDELWSNWPLGHRGLTGTRSNASTHLLCPMWVSVLTISTRSHWLDTVTTSTWGIPLSSSAGRPVWLYKQTFSELTTVFLHDPGPRRSLPVSPATTRAALV